MKFPKSLYSRKEKRVRLANVAPGCYNMREKRENLPPEGGEILLDEQMERFIAAAERMHLAEYVRFESDRRRRMHDAFLQGMARGLGMMVGFAFLGAIVVFILQDIARRNLPGISDFLAQVISLAKMRLQ